MKTAAPLKILIIDDNEASAKTLGWMLELLGNEVRTGHDGMAGIRIAKEFKPHVIMLDIGLPVVNGYEICTAMQKEPELKDTVFIAQTGWGQQEHRDRSKEAGFEYHMVKPVQLPQLQEIFQGIAQKLENAAISPAAPVSQKKAAK